jgi:hypothetical protein
MHSWCFFFPFAALVKQPDCSGAQGLKGLLQLKIWRFMHADTRHSQAGMERNYAIRMTINLLLGAAKLTCR